MYSEPEIVLSNRAYIKVYIDGKRERFYNGKRLGIKCNPNRCKTETQKERAFDKLLYVLKKKLESGWTPSVEKETRNRKVVVVPTVKKCVEEAVLQMEEEGLSDSYLNEIKYTRDEFVNFISDKEELLISELQLAHIKTFLLAFNHSKSMYNGRRQMLGAIFSRIKTAEIIPFNPVYNTKRKKVILSLHTPYQRQQMMGVLERLKLLHPSLHLCALIMYGCGLRPHREIRLLTRGDFNADMTTISLGGEDNKGKKVRTVMVPEFVRPHLLRANSLPSYANIFTGTIDHYGCYYFKTAWKRVADQMVKEKLISKDQTLYSFRHTAAISVYQKTKDPYKVQRFLGHSSLAVTLTYLRNLGLIANAQNEEDLPDL